MESIEFIAGSEKRFSDFISGINDKVALISHVADLDGLTSAKVINEVVKADIVKFVDYHELNKDLANELKKQKVKFVIVADIMIRNEDFVRDIEKFAKLLILDHHMFEKDYNSDRTVFINVEGNCAAYLSYCLFSKIQNLEKYDWLVACACVSDWCYKKNSSFMTKIYEKYKQDYIPSIEGIKKSRFYEIVLDLSRSIVYFREEENDVKSVFEKLKCDSFGDISDLSKYAKVIANEIKNNLTRFEKEKIEFNEGYYFEVNSKFPIKSIVSTDVSERNIEKTIIITLERNGFLEFSCRRQDGKIDMVKFMSELIKEFENSDSGGHFKAVGGHIPVKFKKKFLEKIKKL